MPDPGAVEIVEIVHRRRGRGRAAYHGTVRAVNEVFDGRLEEGEKDEDEGKGDRLEWAESIECAAFTSGSVRWNIYKYETVFVLQLFAYI